MCDVPNGGRRHGKRPAARPRRFWNSAGRGAEVAGGRCPEGTRRPKGTLRQGPPCPGRGGGGEGAGRGRPLSPGAPWAPKPQRAPGSRAEPEVGGWGPGAERPSAPAAQRPARTPPAARHAPPPRPRALTVLLGQGQVRRGEGQEGLVAHVPVQQARDLAMEAGPEVEVLEFQVHLQGERRSPSRGWETRRH